MMCKCGLGHRGWQQPQACNIELSRQAREAKEAGTAAPPAPIAPVLGHPDKPAKPVTVTKQPKKAVTRKAKPLTPKTEPVTEPVTRKTNAQYQQAFKTSKAAAGLFEVRGIWAHPGRHAAIKALAKSA